MMLFTKEITKKLIHNGQTQSGAGHVKPVVKLFTPDAGATWLLSELEVEDTKDGKVRPTGRAFGLCDLGMGFPELGYIDLNEIAELRGTIGLPVERDRYFSADKTLAEYADEARAKGRIAA